jgi:AraC-like DNA-binding protein
MNSTAIASSRFSTGEFDAWRASIEVIFDVSRPDDSAALFTADVEAFQLGDMIVANTKVGAQRYVRAPSRPHRDGIDHFLLNLYRTGGWKAQTKQGEFQGGAGQISILDLSRELVSDEPNSDLLAVFIPRSVIEEQIPNLDGLHGQAPTGPYAVLLAEYLDLLGRRLPTLPEGEEHGLSRATDHMLAACLQPSLAGIEAARPGLELVLRRRAKRFVDAHIGSPRLGVETICEALAVSRRTLYRIFDQDGGVQHYIQSRRLDQIRARLSDPQELRRISEIAAAFGFPRGDHFARAFKRQFGHSPRELRVFEAPPAELTVNAIGKAATDVERFDDWIRTLHG